MFYASLNSTAKNIITAIQDDASLLLNDNEALYVNFIVGRLQEEGLWDKIKALYGFVGGNAETHRWNWKTMLDTDAGFRLSYTSSNTSHYTHNNNGIKSNNTSAVLNTHIKGLDLTTDNNHLSIYCNTSFISSNAIQIGFINIVSPLEQDFIFLRGTNVGFNSSGAGTNDQYVSTSNNNRGFFLGSAPGVSNRKFYKNANLLPLVSTGDRGNNININIDLGILGLTNLPDNTDTLNTFSFASIGDGLTDQEARIMSNIVTTAQKILNRA